MANYPLPLIDEQPENPFYCPEYPSTLFADTLRRRLLSIAGPPPKTGTPFGADNLLWSFARNIVQALSGESSDPSRPLYPDLPSESSTQQDSELYAVPLWERRGLSAAPEKIPRLHRSSVKRKRSSSDDSFSDILRPTKYAKSYQSVHESSFEVEIKSKKLNYFALNAGFSPGDFPRDLIYQPPTKPKSTVLDLGLRIQALQGEYHLSI
jgi:hypothetical protein